MVFSQLPIEHNYFATIRAQRLTASMVFSQLKNSGHNPIELRAQRLTASMVFSRLRIFRYSSALMSAQRLTASMVFSPTQQPHVLTSLTVLNALRHQWYFHQSNISFRHRRIECSTPYGINGIFTELTPKTLADRVQCSTPYGINGIFTATPETFSE